MRRAMLSTLVLAGCFSFAEVAHAGCCDDFWSCAAAVATAGASCAVQSLIDTVNAMVRLVDTVAGDLRTRSGEVVSQAQASMNDATAQMKQLREQTLADIKAKAAKAHDLANPPVTLGIARADVKLLQSGQAAPPRAPTAPAAGGLGPIQAGPLAMRSAPPPPPADPRAIQDAFARADGYERELAAKADGLARDVAAGEKAAGDAVLRHLATAQQISLDIALTPLQVLRDSLMDLLAHPERLFDPSAQIDADIQRITQAVPAMLDRITGEVVQEATADLDAVRPRMQSMQDSLAGAQAVLDLMQQVGNSRSQPDLDALNRALPPPAPPGAALAGRQIAFVPLLAGAGARPMMIPAAFARADVAKLPLVLKHRAALSDLGAKWQSVKMLAKTPAQIDSASAQRVDHDLGQMFAGKQGADAEKKKQELIEEAKKRFGKDPKTFEKVRQYIEAHARSQ